MIHNLDEVPDGTRQPRPAVKTCNLIISQCLERGCTGIRLGGVGFYEGVEVLSVEYLVDGAWQDIMKIPAGPAAAVLATLGRCVTLSLRTIPKTRAPAKSRLEEFTPR